MSTPNPAQVQPNAIPPPPPPGPQPTGNIIIDAYHSVTHIGEIPCARNSLLGGIASGFGIGVIRGISAGPMVAGNWAVAAFAIVSLGSWHLCHKQMADERAKVTKIIENMPRRTLKENDNESPSKTTPS
ncbi:hypothetical protein BDN72DRAFT_168497 [Pluteus cervinus]|uniref:Uncharacterized protein n=1 Tax=Pluteus cervinus TaxID=181527 RepID=A0ACD3B755_9AGAR|nr:hypothetical protein BDN72DRAFT_168497 [Pluteus cervinus]